MSRTPVPPPLTFGLVFLLAMMASGMPVFSDMIIASLPVLQKAFAASDRDTQQIVSLFFLATAFMALCVGALADAYGRRPVVLASFLLLTLSSLGCLVSERIEHLWAMRIVQGAAAGVGMILCRTVVRDLVSGVQAQKSIGHVSLIQTLIPVAMPIIGAGLSAHLGWQAVFACTAGMSFVMLLAYSRLLPETLLPERRQAFRPLALVRAYRTVLGSGVFLRMSVAHAMNWGGMFLYIAAAPKLMLVHLGMDQSDMYLLFVAVMLPMTAGFMLLPVALHRFGATKTLKLAYGVCFAAVALNLAIGALNVTNLLALLPVALYMVGVAATTALLIGAGLEPFPDNAGMASSCQMAIQFLVMGLVSAVFVPLAWGSLLHLALAHAGLVVSGFLLLLWQQRVSRSLSKCSGT